MSEPPHPIPGSSIGRLQNLRRLARLLDNAIGIPGTKLRFGLDPLLGLIPGGGDAIGLLLSSLVVLEAARMGVKQSTLGQMVLNVVLETLAGTFPVLGDVFDLAWKANIKNLELLENDLNLQLEPRRPNWGAVITLTLSLVLGMIGLLLLGIAAIQRIVRSL